MKSRQTNLIGLSLSLCLLAASPAQAQTSPSAAPKTYYDAIKADYEALRGDIYAKQGYPREQSAAMLDPAVRQLLDAALRLYREAGLFTNRAKALQLLGVAQTSRRWSDTQPVEGGHRGNRGQIPIFTMNNENHPSPRQPLPGPTCAASQFMRRAAPAQGQRAQCLPAWARSSGQSSLA